MGSCSIPGRISTAVRSVAFVVFINFQVAEVAGRHVGAWPWSLVLHLARFLQRWLPKLIRPIVFELRKEVLGVVKVLFVVLPRAWNLSFVADFVNEPILAIAPPGGLGALNRGQVILSGLIDLVARLVSARSREVLPHHDVLGLCTKVTILVSANSNFKSSL